MSEKKVLICRRENVEHSNQSLCNHLAFWRTQLIPREIGFPPKASIKFSPKQCNNFSDTEILVGMGRKRQYSEMGGEKW